MYRYLHNKEKYLELFSKYCIHILEAAVFSIPHSLPLHNKQFFYLYKIVLNSNSIKINYHYLFIFVIYKSYILKIIMYRICILLSSIGDAFKDPLGLLINDLLNNSFARESIFIATRGVFSLFDSSLAPVSSRIIICFKLLKK